MGEEKLSDCWFSEETITGGDNQAVSGNNLGQTTMVMFQEAWESRPRPEGRKVRISNYAQKASFGGLVGIQVRAPAHTPSKCSDPIRPVRITGRDSRGAVSATERGGSSIQQEKHPHIDAGSLRLGYE